ncbi:MAG: hypothetical protein WB586_13855 [Chthoniobacterales bacterium]
MPRNHKLTNVIQGRTVRVVTAEPGKVLIRFDDQSTMTVKTAGIVDIFPPGGKIKAIQEDGPEFSLQFEDGSTVSLQLTDPGSSVAVRDKSNAVEYLG